MFNTHYEGTFGFWFRRRVNRKIAMKNIWGKLFRVIEETEDDYLPF